MMITLVDSKDDTWFWVLKIITSCKEIHHINACERLIENYRTMYNDQLLTSKLNAELTFKIHELVIEKYN
jgi:hypothetical protein